MHKTKLVKESIYICGQSVIQPDKVLGNFGHDSDEKGKLPRASNLREVLQEVRDFGGKRVEPVDRFGGGEDFEWGVQEHVDATDDEQYFHEPQVGVLVREGEDFHEDINQKLPRYHVQTKN
jgi:hypothetical protein